MMLTVAPVVASNPTLRRLIGWLALLLAALVLLIASMLTLTIAATPGLVTSTLTTVSDDLPLDQWVLMQRAAAASGCGLDWSILAGIEKQESDFGRNPNMFVAHDGGIVGLVQMQPGNWAIFAPPGGNPFNPGDALPAAARFLCAHGAAQDIRGALFAYNHDGAYVDVVLHWSALYRAALNPPLTDPSGTASGTAGVGGRPDIVAVAETWRGVPYVWGGASRAGIDCSGLVMVVFAQFGVQLPHNAQLQFNAVQHIANDQLQPGDLVFFSQTYPSSEWITHVGIYVGNGQQLNAPTDGQVVSIQPVFSGFWGAHYAGAGRVPLPGRSASCPTCG